MSLLFITGRSQNSPITTAGSITNVIPGTISIPVMVSNFINIGGITLTLDYDPGVLTFQGATHNAAFSGMLITGSTPGRILIGWVGIAGGVTLPDVTDIVDISFIYTSGSSYLSWYDNGGNCEYTLYGSSVPLTDQPTSTYYHNGIVTNHSAPVTTAPVITDVTSGSVIVPITVTNFSDIMVISLTLEYDPTVLTFITGNPNAVFGQDMLVNSLPSTNGKRKIVISYMGLLPINSLADRSHLVDLVFTYSDLQGSNYSELTWKVDGGACEYADQYNNILEDEPTADYYQNGLIASKVSPVTILPTITNAAAGSIDIPVRVTGFNNIKVLSLTFEYNPDVMTYSTQTQNGIFDGELIVFTQPLPNGDKKLIMSWLGVSPVSISDNGTITVLHFTYISGTTSLQWLDNGGSCEYADVHDNPLWDSPTASYYLNGLVTGHSAPRTKAETISVASIGGTVSVPINVWNFHTIGSFSLTLDYDPGVLTFLNATANPLFAAHLSISAASGRILMGWFYTGQYGTSLSLPDSTTILALNFTYHGGTSPLIFYNNGGTCEYTEGVTNEVLYDQPTDIYYINGSVSPNRTLNLKAFIEGLYDNISHQMNQAMNEDASQFPIPIADKISVELHDASNYSHILFTASNVNLSVNGAASVTIPAIYHDPYYITIKNRNSIETVSASPVSLVGSITGYAFDGVLKAYGSNLQPFPDGTWAIISGDVNQDGIIDSGDAALVDNAARFATTGYITEDINGDGLVDASDMNIWDNHAFWGLGAITP